MIGMANCTPVSARSDVGWHVVGAFVCMPISPRLLRRDAFKECLQIGADVPRCILLDEQSRRSVSAEQREEPGPHLVGPQPIDNIARNF